MQPNETLSPLTKIGQITLKSKKTPGTNKNDLKHMYDFDELNKISQKLMKQRISNQFRQMKKIKKREAIFPKTLYETSFLGQSKMSTLRSQVQINPIRIDG